MLDLDEREKRRPLGAGPSSEAQVDEAAAVPSAAGFVPQAVGPSASEQAYGAPLYDKQPGVVPQTETRASHIREFEQMTERAGKFGATPNTVTLPAQAQQGLQHLWEESKAHNHDKERGGNLVRELHNGHMTQFAFREGKPVNGDVSDTFNPDPDDHASNQRVVATMHTHGYASGTVDASFSKEDLSGMADESQHMDLLQSGNTRFMVVKTAEFEARVKDLDDDGVKVLQAQMDATYDKAFAGTEPMPERAERACVAVCRAFKLSYYRGTGDSLNRVV